MWNPTHVQLTVLRARNLLAKGRAGHNDVYVTIQLCKQKFQTSTIKSAHSPEWFEECELEIPSMSECIDLTLYHRGVLQDDFLGHALINLADYKVQERPKSQWLQLKSRPKKPDTKARGDIEVRLSFVVKSVEGAEVKQKKRANSFKSGVKGGKLTFIRSVSFRDRGLTASKSLATDSVLHPADKTWRYSLPVIPTQSEEAGSDGSMYSPDNIVPPMLHTSHGDLTIGQIDEETDYSMSAGVPKPPGHPRQRIHMGSATLTKPDGHISDNRSSSLHYISEEPAPPMPALPRHATSMDENLSLPSSDRHSLSYDAQTVSSVGSPPDTHSHDYTSSGEHTYNSHSRNASDDNSPEMPDRVLYETETRGPRNRMGRARQGYTEQLQSHFDENEIVPNNAPILERAETGSSVTDGKNEVWYDRVRRAYGDEGRAEAAQVPEQLKKAKVDDFVPRRRHSPGTPPIPPPPVRPFATSDSDDYAESSSAQSRHKTGAREEEPMRRRSSKTHRNLLLSPQHRRYSIHGMTGHYDRPALYLYDDIHTCHEEFRRTYLSEDDDPQDLMSVYRNMTKEELIHLCLKSKAQLIRKDQYLHDLELYIDNLLVCVMETTPRILGRSRMSRC